MEFAKSKTVWYLRRSQADATKTGKQPFIPARNLDVDLLRPIQKDSAAWDRSERLTATFGAGNAMPCGCSIGKNTPAVIGRFIPKGHCRRLRS